MAGVVRCPNPVLGYKGNRYRGYKWIPALLKPRGLVKRLAKGLAKGLVKELVKGLAKRIRAKG